MGTAGNDSPILRAFDDLHPFFFQVEFETSTFVKENPGGIVSVFPFIDQVPHCF